MPLTRALLWTAIVSLALAAMMGIMSIILPSAWQTQSRILGTCLLIGGFTLPAFACAAVLSGRRHVLVMWATLVALGIAMLCWLVLVWGNLDWRVEEEVARVAIIFTILGIWGSHFGLLSLLRLFTRAAVAVRLATVACASTLSILGIIGVIIEPDADLYFRTLLVLIILTACGTLVSPIFAMIDSHKARDRNESIPSQVRVQVTCPRCQCSQTLKTGVSKCRECQLRIEIGIEEPRCTCGYLLYKLQGDTCPECGRVIPAGDRWAASATEPQPDEPVVTTPSVSPPYGSGDHAEAQDSTG